MSEEHRLKHKFYNKQFALILPLVAIAITVFVIISLYFVSKMMGPSKVPEEIWPVASQKITRGNYSPVVTLYGKVESFQETKLESTINAYIEKIYVKDGSEVKADQILIKLDDRDVKIMEKERHAEYKQIKAQINQLKAKFASDKMALMQQNERVKYQKKEVERLETLYKRQLSSASLFDQARSLLNEQLLRYTQNQLEVENFKNNLAQKEAELLRAEANLERAKLDVERSTIRAPYAGKVVALNVAIGSRVQPGEVLIELFPLMNIEIRAQVPNKDLPIIKKALKEGSKMQAYAEIDGELLSFDLERVAGTIETGQAGVDAIFSLQTKEQFIARNRIILLKLKLPKINNVFAIPEAAIFHGNTIYQIYDGRLVKLPIEIIGTWYNPQETAYKLVKAPELKDGSIILTTHLLNARNGLKVSVTNRMKQ